jgi:hypothetical protein
MTGSVRSPGSSALPRTYVGRWLRAGMLRQDELRDRLNTTQNGDEPGVVEAAHELVVRHYFGVTPDEGEILAIAGMLEVRTAQAKIPVSEHDVEAVIRSALQGSGAPQGVHRSMLYLLRGHVIMLIAGLLQLAEPEVNALLREAERVAFERGWHPVLVPRGSAREHPGRRDAARDGQAVVADSSGSRETGPAYVTYDPRRDVINIWDTEDRSPSRYPPALPPTVVTAWGAHVTEVVEKYTGPYAAAVRDARQRGHIRVLIYPGSDGIQKFDDIA